MITKHHLICLWKLELFYGISYYQAKKKKKEKLSGLVVIR